MIVANQKLYDRVKHMASTWGVLMNKEGGDEDNECINGSMNPMNQARNQSTCQSESMNAPKQG